MREDSDYPTIRQAARRGPLSEHTLRMMQKQGRLPGFFVGKAYRVNYSELLNVIAKVSKEGGSLFT